MTRPLALVLLVVALAYGQVLVAGYIWDDHALIGANTVLDAPTWDAVFGRDLWWGTGGYQTAYYRPMLTISLLVDRYLLAADPALAHLHSLGWHLLATALVGVVVGRHAGAASGAVAAAVFGLHPIQSEAVVWISARNDLLATTGVLFALVAGERGWVVPTAAATMFAMLAKETGAVTPLLLIAWGYAWNRRIATPVLVASVVGLGLAAALRGAAALAEPTPAFPFGARDPWASVWALARTTSWFVWPWPLTSTTTVYTGRPGAPVWIGAAVVLGLAGLAARREPARVGALLVFAALALAPSVGGLFLYQTVGERYLYLPIVAVAAILGSILYAAPRWVGGGLAAAALVALGLRVRDWKDDATFFVAAAERQPDAYSLSLAGKVLLDARRSEEALQYLEASVTVLPSYPFGCRFITAAARDALTWSETVARAPGWMAVGCRGIPGFDDALAMSAARAGDWDRAAALTAATFATDHSGRFNVVSAAVRAREGDLLGFAFICADQEEGAGSFRARVLPLLQQPLALNLPPL